MVAGLKVSLFLQIFLVISPRYCIYEGGTWFLLHVDSKIVPASYMCVWVCVYLYVYAISGRCGHLIFHDALALYPILLFCSNLHSVLEYSFDIHSWLLCF